MTLFFDLPNNVVIVWCEIDFFYLPLILMIDCLQVLFYETINFVFLLILSSKQ